MDATREFYSRPSSNSFAKIYTKKKHRPSAFFNTACQFEKQNRMTMMKTILSSINLSKVRNTMSTSKTFRKTK